MALCGGIISDRTKADAEFPNGPQLKSALLDAEYQVHTYLYIRHTLELVATHHGDAWQGDVPCPPLRCIRVPTDLPPCAL